MLSEEWKDQSFHPRESQEVGLEVKAVLSTDEYELAKDK